MSPSSTHIYNDLRQTVRSSYDVRGLSHDFTISAAPILLAGHGRVMVVTLVLVLHEQTQPKHYCVSYTYKHKVKKEEIVWCACMHRCL
jgi:hypothetical protein